MRNIKKHILSICLVAMLACMSFATTAFAAELESSTKSKCYTIEVTSEGLASITDKEGKEINTYTTLRSSISGYEQRSLTSNSAGIQVFVEASGCGGMGVTINASSSWSGYMSMNMLGSDGRMTVEGKAVYSNGETYLNNLSHYSPSYYVLTFSGIPSGQSVFVKVWIYG